MGAMFSSRESCSIISLFHTGSTSSLACITWTSCLVFRCLGKSIFFLGGGLVYYRLGLVLNLGTIWGTNDSSLTSSSFFSWVMRFSMLESFKHANFYVDSLRLYKSVETSNSYLTYGWEGGYTISFQLQIGWLWWF